MNQKQYIALIAAVAVLGALAFFSQKVFLPEPPEVKPPEKSQENTKAPLSGTLELVENVTLRVGDQTYSAHAAAGETAFDVMRSLSHLQRFSFTGKEDPALGFFVESINGQTAPDGYYWIFYVNGAQSNTGISQTIIRSGDTIEWRLDNSY